MASSGREWQGVGQFSHTTLGINAMRVGAGVVTAMPLLWFAAGARQLTLTTLGILQYIAPTCQFLLGIWVFNEPFDELRLIGYILIWTGLAVYTASGCIWLVAAAQTGLIIV